MDVQNTHDCHGCSNDVPNAAEFCPFCGANQRRLTTPLNALEAVLIAQSTPTVRETAVISEEVPSTVGYAFDSEPELDDDWDPNFHPRNRRKKLFAGSVIAVCVAAVLVAAGFLAMQIETDDVKPLPLKEEVAQVEPVEEPAVKVAPELPEVRYQMKKRSSAIVLGTTELLLLETKRGSRYDSVEDRAKSVVVRMNHVLKNAELTSDRPIFNARANGDLHEITWRKSDGSLFRVMDVTRTDVKMWSKKNKSHTTRHILANLLADQLNEKIKTFENDQS